MNAILKKLGMDDVDVVGVGANFDFSFVMGGGTSIEGVGFLDGKDIGKTQLYQTHRQSVGIDGGLGLYYIFGDYSDDKNLKKENYKGTNFSIGGDIGLLSANYFWAPKQSINDKSGLRSFLNNDLKEWSGFTVGFGAGGGYLGSKQETEFYKR